MCPLQQRLSKLVDNGTIKSFLHGEDIPTVEDEPEHRTVEVLTITFNNGEVLALSTFCSGSSQNSVFILDE